MEGGFDSGLENLGRVIEPQALIKKKQDEALHRNFRPDRDEQFDRPTPPIQPATETPLKDKLVGAKVLPGGKIDTSKALKGV